MVLGIYGLSVQSGRCLVFHGHVPFRRRHHLPSAPDLEVQIKQNFEQKKKQNTTTKLPLVLVFHLELFMTLLRTEHNLPPPPGCIGLLIRGLMGAKPPTVKLVTSLGCNIKIKTVISLINLPLLIL